ncbi:hypothetical protein AQF52_1875 [Streptomyces venezuelae]|uniref:hypothetical protein n=1 Tax=Streptomyces gardneri TaxID=66892 RepID=UPI0006BC64E2|nr:hypothetical protein [Streptomyces gardneri]ALO07471.1 hypothetical protein AQF52_1875 [Streptomyces venezuelae]QPK44794.1 hypothetical protein H4W23_09325 [Streptomyces gardneri]WRK36105.1 hypothetical protein U0M97_09370 [Streptomyces venezuelae]CUM42209.1 hypothetical protein BN2537_13383 [Streptomyces venezuelae]
MTTAEGWTAAVRDRLAPGRLLPLGAPEDGAWITERAVRTALDGAAAAVRGVVPGELRIGPATESGAESDMDTDADSGTEAGAGPAPEGFPVPPGGLPPGALRISAGFGAAVGRPLPELAAELRTALLTAAEDGLGLVVAAVDLRVTELLDAAPENSGPAAPPPGRPSPATDDPAALAALRVEGVAGVTDTLGPPVHRDSGLVRVELAVTAGHRPLDVARAVRNAVTAAAREATAVTVLVSELR